MGGGQGVKTLAAPNPVSRRITSYNVCYTKLLREEQTFTDPGRIGAIGYCFGGSVVLQMARDGMDLAGVASFHGGLSTDAPAKPGAVKAKVLVLNGADDKFVPPVV